MDHFIQEQHTVLGQAHFPGLDVIAAPAPDDGSQGGGIMGGAERA